MLKEKHGFKNVVMIGDGATDLEACPPAVSVFLSIHLKTGDKLVFKAVIYVISGFRS